MKLGVSLWLMWRLMRKRKQVHKQAALINISTHQLALFFFLPQSMSFFNENIFPYNSVIFWDNYKFSSLRSVNIVATSKIMAI